VAETPQRVPPRHRVAALLLLGGILMAGRLGAVLKGLLAAPEVRPALYQYLVQAEGGGVLYRLQPDRPLDVAVDLPPEAPASLAATFGEPLPINHATAQELCLVPGIGPATATRIVKVREQRGGFHSLQELDQVPGIGPHRLSQWQDRFSFER